METLRQTLFTNWHLVRFLRLLFGLAIGMQAFQMKDPVMGLFSAFFLFQAVTNTGCCGVQGCATLPVKGKPQNAEEVEYNEIKADTHGNK